MGSKASPGSFDCYEAALDDEPMFILLARDESAPDIVVSWAMRRLEDIREEKKPLSDVPMVREALSCAIDMVIWRIANRGAPASGQSATQLPSWHSRQGDFRDQRHLIAELAPFNPRPDPKTAPGGSRCPECLQAWATMPHPACTSENHKREWTFFKLWSTLPEPRPVYADWKVLQVASQAETNPNR